MQTSQLTTSGEFSIGGAQDPQGETFLSGARLRQLIVLYGSKNPPTAANYNPLAKMGVNFAAYQVTAGKTLWVYKMALISNTPNCVFKLGYGDAAVAQEDGVAPANAKKFYPGDDYTQFPNTGAAYVPFWVNIPFPLAPAGKYPFWGANPSGYGAIWLYGEEV